ncbi:MAG: hypothetical protein ACAI37_16710 [Chthoniobacter sp.]
MADYPSWRVEGESRWYDPILERIEAFEVDTNFLEDISEGLADEGPDWVAMTLYNGVTPFRKYLGLENIAEGLHAKRVGTVVGSKVSLCTGMARAHQLFEMMSPKQLAKIEEAWGSEDLAYARGIWKRFADEFKIRADDLRRYGAHLAADQTVEENIKYTMGYRNGERLMVEIGKAFRRALKKQKSKRERDEVARGAVLTFALENWKTIETDRHKLTWMKLTEKFDTETNHQIPIDEETFKKILQRTSLRIGKSSKPMSKGRSRTSNVGGCP